MHIIIISVFFLFFVLTLFGFNIKWIKNKLSSVKETDAEVIEKECFSDLVQGKFEALSSQPQEHYIITFICDNKKRKFNVSGNAYDNYRIGDCGILKYQGNIILDFNKL
ncbi:MAG: DUF2500 domain-containing protein [Clostridia bacterium]|nr:DUF2500 domain-containing protein [Clostridia bacterium]